MFSGEFQDLVESFNLSQSFEGISKVISLTCWFTRCLCIGAPPISSSSSFVNPPAPHTPSYNLAFLYSAAKFSDTFSSCSIPITIFPQSLDELCTSDNRLSILHHFDPMKTRKLKSNTLHWWVDPPRCLQRLCRTYEPTYKDIMAIGQRAVRDAGSAHPSDVISKNNNNPKI